DLGKWGTTKLQAWCLLAANAGERISTRDLATWMGVSHRWARAILDEFVDRKLLEIDIAPAGSQGGISRVPRASLWEVPWRVPREFALRRIDDLLPAPTAQESRLLRGPIA